VVCSHLGSNSHVWTLSCVDRCENIIILFIVYHSMLQVIIKLRHLMHPFSSSATKTCQDLFSERACKSWKSSSLQPCTADKYRYYMMDVCAKTCNFCGCFDKHPPICQSWSRSGVCNWSNIYGTWMKKNCPKSCNTCT